MRRFGPTEFGRLRARSTPQAPRKVAGMMAEARSRPAPPNGWWPRRLRQQTVADISSKAAFAELHDRRIPITAADPPIGRVAAFFDARDVTLCRVRIDRGTAYCGSPERHADALSLAVRDIAEGRCGSRAGTSG